MYIQVDSLILQTPPLLLVFKFFEINCNPSMGGLVHKATSNPHTLIYEIAVLVASYCGSTVLVHYRNLSKDLML